MRTYRWFAASTAALLCLHTHTGLASETEAQPRYWYDGAVKTPLYRQPQLDGPAHGPGAKPVAPQERASPQARAKRSATPDASVHTVYSTAPDANGGRRMIQAPGILFAATDESSAQRAQAWLGARGWHAEPIGAGAVFKVDSVAGEQALDLANALYESGLVKFAQPNWVMNIDRAVAPRAAASSVGAGSLNEPPNATRNRQVERAISDALAPPRQRCAALRAAINQAATDANGSQGARANAQFGWDRRSGNRMLEPPRTSGTDRRTRLENEYSQLDCARQAP